MGSRSFPDFIQLSQEITLCKVCNTHLPNGPRPVFQAHPSAQILIVGQVPGNAVDQSGIPFNDPSGDRLRAWLGINNATFYEKQKIAIVAKGFY